MSLSQYKIEDISKQYGSQLEAFLTPNIEDSDEEKDKKGLRNKLICSLNVIIDKLEKTQKNEIKNEELYQCVHKTWGMMVMLYKKIGNNPALMQNIIGNNLLAHNIRNLFVGYGVVDRIINNNSVDERLIQSFIAKDNSLRKYLNYVLDNDDLIRYEIEHSEPSQEYLEYERNPDDNIFETKTIH